MEILKVLGLLINYPTAEVGAHRVDLEESIKKSREISPELRSKLLASVANIYEADIMDAQENYGLLFDQGRSMSLHLFEHVHGESRDRGQAMVDLMEIYKQQGFEMAALELPDYIPLFLEYLATRPDIEAREWLADVSHILAQLCARLYQRGTTEDEFANHYAVMLEGLLVIAGARTQLEEIREQVALETPDNTLEAIDKEWEETAVTFGPAADACGPEKKTTVSDTQALQWVDPNGNTPANQSLNKRHTV